MPMNLLKFSENFEFKTKVIWEYMLQLTILHLAAFNGLFLLLTVGTWKTLLWTYLLIVIGFVGIAAGVHRLWSHRTYQANLPLRIVLMLLQTMCFQKTIYEWARDHRVHHKFTHTDADPHNPERGYFFAHIGWLMMKKHKEVIIKGDGIDLSDLDADPVVAFQKRYYPQLVTLMAFVFPAMVPYFFWNENLWVCWFGPTFLRFACTLNMTLLINSLAHSWGTRPYDKTIGPVDNAFLAFVNLGEGWHNYHHVFPWDYKTGELGGYGLNMTTLVLDFFWMLGCAYNFKTASLGMVNKRRRRTGDVKTNYSFLEHHYHDHGQRDGIWGWGDTDMKDEQIEKVKLYNHLY